MSLRLQLASLFLLSLYMCSEVMSSQCHSSCDCRWKHGKQTVECLRGNLDALPDSLDPDTQVLDLSRNILQRLPAGAFADAKLVNLQKLLMKACGLRQVDAHAFVQLTNLVFLDLSENKLGVVPDAALKHTVSLRELDLHGNLINFVPAELPMELIKLDLSHCKISSIHIRAFIKLTKLQSLKLDHNKLTHFETKLVMTLNRVQNIDLHMNPWHCDCQLRALHRWLKNVSHTTSPQCHRPQRLEGKSFNKIKLNSFACAPQVLLTGERAHGKAGRNITAWCPVSGVPTPTVSWFFGDIPIYNASKVGAGKAYIMNEISEEKGSLLLISGSVVKDSGAKLRCVATNAAGAATASFVLKVDNSPSFLALTFDQIIGLSCAIILGIVIASCICIVIARRRRRKPATKINGNLVLTFPAGGGSVLAARTPDDNRDDYESEYHDNHEDYTKTNLPVSRQNSLVTTLIDTGEEECEELIHRTPLNQRPLTGVWPAQALALLDSAAPEHIMYSTIGRGNRQSLLPDFAPDYSSNNWPCHFSTLPRTQRQDTQQFHQRSYTPEEASICPPNYMTNMVIPDPCPPPPPLTPSAMPLSSAACGVPPPPLLMSQQGISSPPAPMANLHTKLNRITARDSPDEGYQEGTDV